MLRGICQLLPSREGVAVIQEQQQEMRKRWGDQARWLFPDKNGQPFKQATFADNLNRLAHRKQIRDAAQQATEH